MSWNLEMDMLMMNKMIYFHLKMCLEKLLPLIQIPLRKIVGAIPKQFNSTHKKNVEINNSIS